MGHGEEVPKLVGREIDGIGAGGEGVEAEVDCVALIAILLLVSVFIISNTIKLTTFDRREEIAIMRMEGRTH